MLREVRPGIRASVVVALDCCTDGSARVAAAHDVVVATLAGRGVGAARDAAVSRGLAAWHARHRLVEGHAHVHGANLGVRASRWRQAGGLGPRLVGQDVHLVERVRAVTGRWVATDTTRVLTSGRAHSLVDEGFAGRLRELEADAV